jgi:malonyl-CoA O-methyltransferase
MDDQIRAQPQTSQAAVSDAPLARKTIRTHFGKAASSYAAAAVLQHEVEDRLLERLTLCKTKPERVLDAGCGPGRGLQQLHQAFPDALLMGLDLALPMLEQAKPKSSWWKPFAKPAFARLNGDVSQLPIAASTLDLLYSNLCMQWCTDLPALFAEWRRVMRPDALLLATSFGPDTLKELRAAWASVDQGPHVNVFFDMHDIGDQMLAAGFIDPVLETERFTLTYADVPALLHELKAIGATNAMQARKPGIGGRAALSEMIKAYPRQADGRIAATYEVIYLQAFAPAFGAPIRHAGQEIASVPLSAIRRNQRR